MPISCGVGSPEALYLSNGTRDVPIRHHVQRLYVFVVQWRYMPLLNDIIMPRFISACSVYHFGQSPNFTTTTTPTLM